MPDRFFHLQCTARKLVRSRRSVSRSVRSPQAVAALPDDAANARVDVAGIPIRCLLPFRPACQPKSHDYDTGYLARHFPAVITTAVTRGPFFVGLRLRQGFGSGAFIDARRR
jgi:hypothetical protein